jgi:nucleoside phosphorylase
MRARLDFDQAELGEDAVRFVGVTSEAELQQANLTGGEDRHFAEAGTRHETSHRSCAAAPIFGILTALPEEFAAMRSFIDGPQRANVEGDRADYLIGTMPSADPGGTHPVALTILSETGNDAAASACTNLLRSYRSVRCLLMAGIAAGVPDPGRPGRHVRLGDIVVARGIVAYDSVRETDDGPVSRRVFPPPSPLLERRARLLHAGEMTGSRPWEDLLAAQVRIFPGFGRPPESTDVVYSPDDPDSEVQHPDMALSGHRPGQPKVHSGLIASGDRSLRSARKRDEIAALHDVLAIEMEGKGIGNTGFNEGAEWFTVRGISDYGDRHTSQTWRSYASMAAAAYVRALLAVTPAATGQNALPGTVYMFWPGEAVVDPLEHLGGALERNRVQRGQDRLLLVQEIGS